MLDRFVSWEQSLLAVVTAAFIRPKRPGGLVPSSRVVVTLDNTDKRTYPF